MPGNNASFSQKMTYFSHLSDLQDLTFENVKAKCRQYRLPVFSERSYFWKPGIGLLSNQVFKSLCIFLVWGKLLNECYDTSPFNLRQGLLRVLKSLEPKSIILTKQRRVCWSMHIGL